MAKVKFTKNELKKQKDDLKRFERYLPTLELKKKQLLQEMRKIQALIRKLKGEISGFENEILKWVDVFAEDIDLKEFFSVKQVIVDTGNIAGIDIPVFKETIFEDTEYDLFATPLWVDKGIEACKELIKRKAELEIMEKQRGIIKNEIRVTVQRINLFEKVKIPECRENIRVINIFMGDQQTAEVVRGKIAKAKIERKKQAAGAL